MVDHCVPAEVARWLSEQGHEAWTASQANLAAASDLELIVYAYDRNAVLVTTNRDCAQAARRQRTASVVWLQVREPDALDAMRRGADWLKGQRLPTGRVLRVPKRAELSLLRPLALG